MLQERPIVFSCNKSRLVAILHPAGHDAGTGIVIVVGGPQYRVGSHRQFVLMARQFAAAGIPVLRFDYRGMGDAEGETRPFDQVEDDIGAAIDAFTEAQPQINNVILLGLCDAASANLIYAHTDERVRGLILLNPWVRTEQGEAKTYLRHYYLQRLFQKSFWRKVVSGDFVVGRSLRDFLEIRRKARLPQNNEKTTQSQSGGSFVSRMLAGLADFRRPILFLISGRDLTAKEFVDLCHEDDDFRRALERPQCEFYNLPDADHTLSRRQDMEHSAECAIGWLERIELAQPAGTAKE